MDAHVAGAAKLAVQRRQVKCVRSFVLKFQKLDDRVVAGDKFGDGVGEITRAARRHVAFNDGQPAVRLRDDDIARLNRRAALAGGGDVDELHRFFNRLARRHVNESAVEEEGLVKRGEGIVAGRR